MIDYPFVSLALVAFAIFMYVVLDGFGLGVGILLPFMNEKEQDTALLSIAPFWDGNETWLVLGGALLYAAFPLACSVILPLVYIPLMLMLCALVGRGVAFEFRGKASQSKALWAKCFFFSSLLATFCQGVLLANFIRLGDPSAIPMSITPFVTLCGVGLCFGYALLGAGWLIIKTEGLLEKKIRLLALNLYGSVLLVLIAVLIVTPMTVPSIAAMWGGIHLWLLFLLLLGYFLGIVYAFWQTYIGATFWPFIGSVWLFLGSFLTLVFTIYPYILPGKSYRVLASHPSALKLVVWGCLIMLPVLLCYTAYAYWVFWGKVDENATTYH